MRNYLSEGTALRIQIKALVLDYMKNIPDCAPNSEGMTQAEIFRECGLDWGDYPNAESRRQQYWLIAILRELENEGGLQRDIATKKWRVR
jgi:hypothetical protein